MKRSRTIVLWSASALMGLLFCAAGIPKLSGGAAAQFGAWGYPAWLAVVVGVVETLGGVALLVPRVARFGALVLTLVMAGAAFTHGRAEEWARVPYVVGLAIVLLLLFRARHGRATSVRNAVDA